jgi:hypothetical protein
MEKEGKFKIVYNLPFEYSLTSEEVEPVTRWVSIH